LGVIGETQTPAVVTRDLKSRMQIGQIQQKRKLGMITTDFDFDSDFLPHEHFMKLALQQAVAAFELDEVPVGAVIVLDGRVIGAAHNRSIQLRDPTAHAEMMAITQAAEAIGDWRLENCTLYATLEPCPMCAGAIVQSRIPHVVFGATDPKSGAVKSVYQLLSDQRLNHRSTIVDGVMQADCGAILTEFFRQKRAAGKK
jgi:tRNA(adenine34) deaminase